MLRITAEDDQGSIVIEFAAEEEKAANVRAVRPALIYANWANVRKGKDVDAVVAQCSDRQPAKLSYAEKLAIVADADIQSAAERQAEFEATLPQ